MDVLLRWVGESEHDLGGCEQGRTLGFAQPLGDDHAKPSAALGHRPVERADPAGRQRDDVAPSVSGINRALDQRIRFQAYKKTAQRLRLQPLSTRERDRTQGALAMDMPYLREVAETKL